MAGDLLAAESDQERARLLIATGFLAIGTKNLDEASELQFQADVVDEQIDSVSRAFLAGTIACARCHDHKSDPFSMQDYYALAGIFSSSKTWFGTAVSPANRVGGDPLVLPAGPWAPVLHTGTSAAAVEKMQQELAALTEEKKARTDAVLKAIAEGRNPEGEFSIRDALRIFWRSGALEGELEKVDSSGQPLTLAMGLTDQPAPADAPLLQRGDVLKPDQPIARDVPAVFRRHLPADANRKNTVLEIPEGQSGRFQLAQWIASPANPLTARVFVNRVWAHLMGRGLVPSVDHFGPGGQSSDHQALLDYLAVDFMEHGWSVKYLIRQIVSSRAYRQSSAWQSTAFSADPDNRWFGRMPSRRLEAEAIRDALLCASGELQSERPVGSLVATLVGDRPVALIGLDPRIPADLDGSLHRSVYLPIMRNRLPEVLDVFDFPEPSGVIGTREVTNVPTQALYLMNSPFVQKRGEGLAARVRSMSEDAREQVQLMFELCFARRPSEEESERVIAFLQRSDAEGDLLTTVAVSLFCTAEFRTLD